MLKWQCGYLPLTFSVSQASARAVPTSCSKRWHPVGPSLRPMSGEFPNCLTRTTVCWSRPGSPSYSERHWRPPCRTIGVRNTSGVRCPACRGAISVRDFTVSCTRRCFTRRCNSLVHSKGHFSRKGTIRGAAVRLQGSALDDSTVAWRPRIPPRLPSYIAGYCNKLRLYELVCGLHRCSRHSIIGYVEAIWARTMLA
jgi:hypothetical protein